MMCKWQKQVIYKQWKYLNMEKFQEAFSFSNWAKWENLEVTRHRQVRFFLKWIFKIEYADGNASGT